MSPIPMLIFPLLHFQIKTSWCKQNDQNQKQNPGSPVAVSHVTSPKRPLTEDCFWKVQQAQKEMMFLHVLKLKLNPH